MTKKERKQQGRNAYAQNIINRGQRVTIGGVEYACSHMAQDVGPHGNLIKYPVGLVLVSYQPNKHDR